jgi:mannosyltransferase OCH1-like enzyme
MRYEILFEQGGVYVDADSTSVRPLDSWLLAPGMVAAWESEQHRPGFIATTFIGSVPQHPVLSTIIRATSRIYQDDPPFLRARGNYSSIDSISAGTF